LSLLLHLMLATAVAIPRPERAPPVVAFVPEAEVVVTPGEEAIVEGELRLEVLDGGPLAVPVGDARIALTELTVDGRPAGVLQQGQSLVLVGAWSAGTHIVRYSARARVQGGVESGQLELLLPPAARTRVRVDTEVEVEVEGAIASGEAHFQIASASGDSAPVTVSWRPKGPTPVRERRVRVDQQTALSVDEAEVRAISFLDVRVEHGALDVLPLRIPGGAEAVEVLSPAGAVVDGGGEQVTIRLSDPITDLARVVLRYRSAAPGEDGSAVPVPVRPAFRGEHTVAILRTDDAVVIPKSGSGTGIAFADLPAELRSSLPGTPVAAFSDIDPAGTAFEWRRLETTPAPEPEIIVDHARYEASFAESGSGAMRATWQVRNDRAPFLSVRLPEDWRAVSVRVAGRPVTVSRSGDTLLIPLEKSTETLAGRVQLPVELSAVGPGQPWVKRGWQALEGPAVDAPVSRVEWQINLPPGRMVRQTEGARPPAPSTHTVDMGVAHRLDVGNENTFNFDGLDSEGGGGGGDAVTLGGQRGPKKKKGKDKSGAADASKAQQLIEQTARKRTSTAYWSAAYDAYKDNDFDEAEALLASSLQLDPDNVAAQQLQSNMVIVNSAGGSSSGADEAVARRVKAMARAKADRTVELQDQLAEEALRAEQSGDLMAASSAYQKLAKTTEQLAILEEDEAVDQKRRLVEVERKIESLKKEAEKKPSFQQLDAGLLTVTDEEPEEEEGEAQVLTRDFLQRVPAGRSYQAAVQVEGGVVGGVVGGTLGGAAGAAADSYGDQVVLGTDGRTVPTWDRNGVQDPTGTFTGAAGFMVEPGGRPGAAATDVDKDASRGANAPTPAPVVLAPPPPAATPAPAPPPSEPTTGMAFGAGLGGGGIADGKIGGKGIVGTPVQAAVDQTEAGGDHRYRARTEIDFESLDVSGELVRPQGAMLLEEANVDIADDDDVYFDDIDAPDDLMESMPEPASAEMVVSSSSRMSRYRPRLPSPPSVSDVLYNMEQRKLQRQRQAAAEAAYRPPLPPAAPGMTPLPEGVSAARGDIALPVDPSRLLHVEQQLLPAGTAATFDIRIRTRDP